MKEIYCKVYGELLGDVFKTWAQTKARELSITGYVTRLEDGSAEVVAQGTDENLQKFLSLVSVGPEDAPVESINFQKGPVEEQFSQFDIL